MTTFDEKGSNDSSPGGVPGQSDDKAIDDTSPDMPMAEDGQDRGPKLPIYSTSPKRLWIPIVICIVGAGLLSVCLYFVDGLPDYSIADPSLGFGASVIDAVLFVAMGAVAAAILIKVVIKRGINALAKVMIGAFLLLGTVIIWMYGLFLLTIVDQLFLGGTMDLAWSYAWLGSSFAISLVLVWLYASPRFAERQGFQNAVVVIFGVLIGSFMASIIGTWTSILILIGYSFYDIYSVRKGPIKTMMQHVDPDSRVGDFTGVDLDDITIDIGIGDLVFYSMLTSITLISWEWGGPGLVALAGNPSLYFIPFAAAVVGVMIGAWISFELVKKKQILPGLPMSIFIGIGLYSLAIGICMLFI